MMYNNRRQFMAQLGAAAALGVAALPRPSMAHRANAALTVIDFDTDLRMVEITHRLFAHDLEHAFHLGNVGVGYFDTALGQQQVIDYVRPRFTMGLATQEQTELATIALETLGAEVTGDLIYIYQQCVQPRGVTRLSVDNQILLDVFPEQHNLVNVHYAGAVFSQFYWRDNTSQSSSSVMGFTDADVARHRQQSGGN